MRSYARNQGSPVPNTVLARDVSANDEESMSQETVATYLNALRKIFVVEDMPAWKPNLRSKTAIRSSDTRYYVDPSIAAAALGIGPNDLINDLNTFGFIFETLCVRDLRIFADALDGQVYHYRDKDGMESKIDTDKMKAPSFLMVLTGVGGYAYRRKDGVCVVPIGCLRH